MRIAVTSQNFRTITGHAGKTRRFLVFEVEPGRAPVEVDRLDLPKELSLHAYHGDDHPLYHLGLDLIVTGGAGAGFLQRMARRGIRVVSTAESDITAAVTAIAAGERLPAAAPDRHEPAR